MRTQKYYWSTTKEGYTCLMRGALPLYVIQPDSKYFNLMYYGVCGVHSSKTMDEAKAYIREKLKGYRITVE